MITLEELYVLNKLAMHVYGVAAQHGFHDPDQDAAGVARFCANLHGEVSELWEAHRKGRLKDPCDKAGKMEATGLPPLTCAEEELADILIRVLDTARALNVDIAGAVYWKDRFNQTRPFRHGDKAA